MATPRRFIVLDLRASSRCCRVFTELQRAGAGGRLKGKCSALQCIGSARSAPSRALSQKGEPARPMPSPSQIKPLLSLGPDGWDQISKWAVSRAGGGGGGGGERNSTQSCARFDLNTLRYFARHGWQGFDLFIFFISPYARHEGPLHILSKNEKGTAARL